MPYASVFRVVVAAQMVTLSMTACGIFIQPTNSADVASYNNQMFQLVTSLVTVISTLVGFIGLWFKSNRDKQELAEKTRLAAEELTAASQERNQKVLEKVQENTVINVNALDAANSHNEKLLALQQQVADVAKRGGRATDPAQGDRVQKVEIVGGPGVESALKVQEEMRDELPK